jgi:hypothetical protein
MPLIAAPVVAPETPPAVTPPMEIPDLGGYAAITYIDPTGRRWPMTDVTADWYTLAEGVSGMGAAEYALVSDPHPRGGARLRHSQVQPRTIVWPVLVKGADHMVFTKTWRALAQAFTRTIREGRPGTLEVARPDGTARRIPVFYERGWDGQGRTATGITWDSAVVTLWCEDPYWVDVQAQTVHRETGALADYQVPFPTVSSSQVLGATTVTNPGDIEVWPTWRVSGPASSVTMTREDTNESFTVDLEETTHGPLLAGESMTISTDLPSIRANNGDNLSGGLSWPDTVLWSLPPGETPVVFQVDGSGPGSSVDLTYYPRYETA